MGGGDDPAKVFVSVHYWRALINRSRQVPVDCLVINKEGNEWSSQAEGDSLIPGGVPALDSAGPPAQKLVWIASLVRLNRSHSVHTPLSENKSVSQLLGLPHFARMPFVAKTRASTNCWVCRTYALCPHTNFCDKRAFTNCWVPRTLPVCCMFFFHWSTTNDFLVVC